MKIIINACNLSLGGGESIGLGVIESIYNSENKDIIQIITPHTVAYNRFESREHIEVKRIPPFYTRYLIGSFFRSLYLMHQVRKFKPDVIFSMGNYAIPSRKKQLVLLHWPYLVYPDSLAWKQMGTLNYLKRKIRARVVCYKLRYATAITLQTNLMKERFMRYVSYKGPIYTVESTVSFNIGQEKNTPSKALELIQQKRLLYDKHVFILFMSIYYTHKNLEILIPLAKKIKQNNTPFKLFISLDPTQNKHAYKLLDTIKKEKLDDIIMNLGALKKQELLSIYKNSDAFFMPTLIETFGITYLEAMSTGLPIFTSDLDFAYEVCGDAAFYFDPLDEQSIYDSFVSAFQKPESIRHKIEIGKIKASAFLSWEEITKQYLQILKEL